MVGPDPLVAKVNTTLNLRPYQSEALTAVRSAYKAGKRRVIVSLPTGTGKTVVFAHFPKVLQMKKRLLVLAHREELLLRARDKFQSIDPELKAEIEQAGSRAAADAKVVIASIPTLARNAARLSRLQPDEFSIIVVDWTHSTCARICLTTVATLDEVRGVEDRKRIRMLPESL